MKYPLKAFAALSMGVLLSASTATAAVIAYEGFDYSTLNDGDDLGSVNGGSGWTEGWNGVSSSSGAYRTPGLTYGGLSTTEGAVQWDTSSGSFGRAYDATAGGLVDLSASGSVSWFSFLTRMDETPAFNAHRILFYTGGAGSSNGLGVNFDTTGHIAARITGSEGSYSANNLTIGDGTLGSGEPGFVIGRITYGGDQTGDADTTVDLWLNPENFSTVANLGTPDATNSRTADALGNFSFGSATDMYLRTDNSIPQLFDEIRLGTEFIDVVPEPSTYAFIGGALALGLALWRRR